eukprot:294760-Lingulodinium_polyedra.AAC.1
MARSNRRFAVATAHKPHTRAPHARAEKRPAHRVRKRDLRRHCRDLRAVSTVLLGRYLNAA